MKLEDLKWLRRLLTRQPLRPFWVAAGWTLIANVLLVGAFLAFGSDPHWLRDDLGFLCCVLLLEFTVFVVSWYLDEADRKRKKQEEEKQHDEKEYCRFHKTYH